MSHTQHAKEEKGKQSRPENVEPESSTAAPEDGKSDVTQLDLECMESLEDDTRLPTASNPGHSHQTAEKVDKQYLYKMISNSNSTDEEKAAVIFSIVEHQAVEIEALKRQAKAHSMNQGNPARSNLGGLYSELMQQNHHFQEIMRSEQLRRQEWAGRLQGAISDLGASTSTDRTSMVLSGAPSELQGWLPESERKVEASHLQHNRALRAKELERQVQERQHPRDFVMSSVPHTFEALPPQSSPMPSAVNVAALASARVSRELCLIQGLGGSMLPMSDRFRSPTQGKMRLYPQPSSEVVSTNAPAEAGPETTPQSDMAGTYCRKDKSLGHLCERFFDLFGTGNEPVITLDDAVTRLGVTRRRIYDVVNVLESLEVVVRVQKKTYTWHGLSRLPEVLSKLKDSGIQELGTSVFENGQLPTVPLVADGIDPEDEDDAEAANSKGGAAASSSGASTPGGLPGGDSRREKMLGLLTQKFVQLFLISGSKVLPLEDAAKALFGACIDPIYPGKLQTKVRRVYDIANVLVSLHLIEKTKLSNSSKPAYRWLDTENEIKKNKSAYGITLPWLLRDRPPSVDATPPTEGDDSSGTQLQKHASVPPADGDTASNILGRKRLAGEAIEAPGTHGDGAETSQPASSKRHCTPARENPKESASADAAADAPAAPIRPEGLPASHAQSEVVHNPESVSAACS
ncbi:E2F/DP winged-helix DNA-binding domain, variant 2 [Cymbomonas tetramitiformis]|uniref:E2F/DP winged-helix DNA-binding domain, variant 2 n=1 Tax=Cymbomonas tetramitiformis TaxID=36881 RepID=A0AAE0BNK7_9CHLO|nr:E2F/DP winged-helix DNA-binding domain, variant 2 [Cymbomonas tetramitiformis]